MNGIHHIVSEILKEAIQREEIDDEVAAAYVVFVEVGIELSKLFSDMRFQERKSKE